MKRSSWSAVGIKPICLGFVPLFLSLCSSLASADEWAMTESLQLKVSERVCLEPDPFPCQLDMILSKSIEIRFRRSDMWPFSVQTGAGLDHFSGSWAADLEKHGAQYRVVVVIEGYLKNDQSDLSDKTYSLFIYSSKGKEVLRKTSVPAPLGHLSLTGPGVQVGDGISILKVEISPSCNRGGGDPFPGTSGGT